MKLNVSNIQRYKSYLVPLQFIDKIKYVYFDYRKVIDRIYFNLMNGKKQLPEASNFSIGIVFLAV